MIDKRVASAAEAVSDIFDGASIMFSGFGEAGSPIELIHALIDQGATNLTMISNNCGSGEVGLAALLKAGRVSKVVCSFPRTANSTVFPELSRSGRTTLELVPQGTLAERIRAGGAGIPAFYTPSAVGTPLAEGKESREFDGRKYLLEHGIRADFSLIKGRVADTHGNILYNKTARNFGPVMAMAAKVTIVQVAEVVEAGELDPESIVTPGIFVDRVVAMTKPPVIGRTREEMAQRLAQDIPDGSYVNLGIGIPELVAKFVPAGRSLIYHTENGMLGMGPAPRPGDGDPELINAGKRHVTALPGTAYFHHADSFAMIRGGHLDVCVLGALQVAQNGDLANWSTGEPDAIPAVGGAMDLVAGVKSIFVVTQHCTREGEAKLVQTCTFPLTGLAVVNRIYTDLAVIEVTPNGFRLVELSPGIDFDYVQERTAAPLLRNPELTEAR